MLKKLAPFFLLLGISAASAQQLSNLPPNTVVGRLGAGTAGPAQAIPFATLLAQLNGVTGVITGPLSSTAGHVATWNNATGTLLADGGAISIASGKTVTDTSGVGAILLLGSTGGGFAGYGGATCTNGAITILSTAGAPTCLPNRATSQKQVASPAGPNSTSVFKMQGLAGTITPAVSGNIQITISGTITEAGITAAGSGISYQLSYGTSSAPTSNAALAGTQVGTVQEYMLANTVTAADVIVPFSTTVVVTGLTVGTPYWIDLAAEAVTNTGFALSAVSVSANEI